MKRPLLFNDENKELVNLKEASIWASNYLNRKITISNISYLILYGRVKKFGSNGNPLLNILKLREYYDSCSKEKKWKKKSG